VRLFVALELPIPVRDALAARTAAWVAGGPLRLRPVAAPDLHVTLCFLGDQPDTAVAAIGEALGAALAATAPVRVGFGTPLWLPPRRPRVLAVRLSGPDALTAVQARVATALAAGGWYTPERRPFLAHVTVARVPGGSGPAAPGIHDVPDVPEGRFEAGEVALIRSRLGAGPARYERLVVCTLAPPG
jgi:2'-5' RNA ligase